MSARQSWMAPLILLAVASGAATAQSPGMWDALPGLPEAESRYDDVRFVDAQTGWMADLGGRLVGTTDGGQTWATLYDESSPGDFGGFRSLVFVNAQHGWIGALDLTSTTGVLLETTDGGQTLADVSDRIVGPRPRGLCGLWAVDEQTVYAVGGIFGDALFLETNNGGQSWTSRDLSADVPELLLLIDVYFFDHNRGLATGKIAEGGEERAVVIGTEDGGQSWTVRHVSSGVDELGWKLSFPSATVGYAAVQGFEPAQAKVLKTTDGGLSWIELPMPPGVFFSGIAFMSETVGWVGGMFDADRPLAQTVDGGQTWTVPPMAPDPSVINRLRFFTFGDETVGFAGGGLGYRYRPTSTPTGAGPVAPTAMRLGAPVPNPTRGPTRFPYVLEAAGPIRLELIDALGRRVAVLAEGTRDAGAHAAGWNGTDAQGRPLAAGVYLVRLVAHGQTLTQSLTVME